MVLIGILSVLGLLFVAMGVIDFRARRRGVRLRGVDASKSRNDLRAQEAQMRSQMGGSNGMNGMGGF